MPLGTEVGLSLDDIVLDGDPAPPLQKGGGSPSSVFGSCLWWPNGWMDEDGTWRGSGPWSRPHCARWGSSSLPKKGQSPHLYCGQTAVCIKMPLGMEVGLSPGDFVLDGDPAPLPQNGGGALQSLAHVYCSQTPVCMRIPFGTEVGLSLGNIVLDGDPAACPLKGHSPPIFGQCLLWPNGWMDGLKCHLVWR